MSTITINISNNSYLDNNPYDPLFDFDDLFSSTYTFVPNNEHHDDSMWIKEEPEEISSLSSAEVNILKTINDFIFILLNSD